MIETFTGDCREVLLAQPDNHFHACVTDPPYELGFMGKAWDRSGVSFQPETWRHVFRVMRPGAHLLAFGGTRTYHRLVCAIEDAGFEVRDQIDWIFGSGFPKSRNQTGDWQGWGSQLKPGHEPIVLARKPLQGTLPENLARWGCGALNIDACRIPGEVAGPGTTPPSSTGGRRNAMNAGMDRVGYDGSRGRWPANVIHDGSDEVLELFPDAPGQQGDASDDQSTRRNQNVYNRMRQGSVPPASSAVGFRMKAGPRRLDSGSAARFFFCAKASSADRHEGLGHVAPQFESGAMLRDAERVGAARQGNHHPTVKPTELMRYLCRMVTPPTGVVLDPFMGSGSTLKAAELEGFSAVGIDLDPDYVSIARRRIAGDAPLFQEPV